MINTYNENLIHKELKSQYAAKYNGKIEEKIDTYICDVYSKEAGIFEIQTSNLFKLKNKIFSLAKNFKITLVYPIILEKTIIKINSQGMIISERKSPKRKKFIQIFEEIAGSYSLFFEENFSFHVVPITITETRMITDAPVQNFSKSRKKLQNWILLEKRITKQFDTIYVHKREDLLQFIPKNLPKIFTAKDIKVTEKIKNPYKILWTLEHLQFVQVKEIKGRIKYFTFLA